MVTKFFICPNGHRWQDADDCRQCPVCGAQAAETIGDGNGEHESTHASEPGSQSAAHSSTEHSKFGRYKIIEELGRGGMGIVYRAFDPVDEREVALKTLPSIDPVSLSRFKREFRALSEVDHPNVVKLFELTSDGETWFFTMEIIDGVDLLTHVGAGGDIPHRAAKDETALTEQFNPFELSTEKEQRVRDAFSQLAGAISALHTSGIVHRDLKPSNVIVTPDGRVVLLDFGLVAETDSSGIYESLHQGVMGTAAYMSPEQAACDPVSSASDWYSVGVMLYQSLTGRLPFTGNAVDVLFNKQKQQPVPPCEIESSVSRDWNNLCMVLLCRNPENRPSGKEIVQRFGDRPFHTAPTQPAPAEIALVGRESQLRAIHEAWREVRAGAPKCVFVEGRSGMGKSALVEAFLQQVTREGAVALHGRCYEMESVPFKAIDSLVDSLVEYLAHLPQADAAALMPRDVHALARLFPVIGQVEAIATLPRRQIDISDQKELNRRAIGALRELLARIGDRYPLIVYIDDLQWGDEDSAAMLSDLLQPPDSPTLLFLGTYRSEDAETSQFLQSFRQIQRQRESPLESLQVGVTPLERSDAAKLALALLGSDDAAAPRNAEMIARESAGNPFFVSELVKHLHLEGGSVSDSSEPLVLIDMIWSRVCRLPSESQRLLAVVALWGQPLPLDRAMRLAEVGQSAVGPLRSGHLIRTVGLAVSSKVETYHDRIRQSVSERLDRATKQQHHLRIAEDCVSQSPINAGKILKRLKAYFAEGPAQMNDHLEVDSSWYDVAFHYDAAERSDLAFPYALATAEQARSQFSLEVAEQQYRIVERDVDNRDEAVRYRVAEGLGDVLMVRGNYDEARMRFDRACELAPDSGAGIAAKLGELEFRQGDMEKAIEVFERALELLGHSVPGRSLGIYFRLTREAFVQILHSLFPKLSVARKKNEDMEQPLLVVRLHNRLTYAYFFEHRMMCLWSHLRGMNLAERYPPTLELAHAYAIHAPVMGLVALFKRGIAYAEKSSAIYTSLGDVWGQGLALSFHGLVLYAASRFEEGTEKCREASKLLESAGDLWEVNVARVHTAFCLFKRGQLGDSAALAKRVHLSGVELGDSKASGFSLDVWAWSTGGQVPTEVLQTELQRPRDDVQVSAQVMMAEGVRLFMMDQFEQAAEVFQRGHQLAEDAGLRNSYVLPLRSWFASALRRQAESIDHREPEGRDTLLKRAQKIAGKAIRVAYKFRNDLPHALREAGLISALQGSERRARKYLDESLEVAKQQGAEFEYAQTLMARGSVGLAFNWPGAAEEVASARQALIELGAEFALAHCDAQTLDDGQRRGT